MTVQHFLLDVPVAEHIYLKVQEAAERSGCPIEDMAMALLEYSFLVERQEPRH